MVARGIAHTIDAEYGMAAGLVACADYSVSLTIDQLLMRFGNTTANPKPRALGGAASRPGAEILGMVATR
jgi:hypothetical protein